MPDNRAPGLLTKREEDALAYVDKGLDNIKGGEYVWSNAEVVELLEDIRSILLTGEITPGGFDWPDTPEAVDAHYRACNPESTDQWVTAPDGEDFRVGQCQGHAECPVETHEHGCYADAGNCDHPEDHESG